MSQSSLSILRPPGHGLLTISSGSGAAKKALKPYFHTTDWKNWASRVDASLKSKTPFSIIGVPSDSGGGICRGAAHGPLRIRELLYKSEKKWSSYDLGDIPCIPQLVHDSMLSYAQRIQSAKTLWGHHFKESSPASPLNILADLLEELFTERPHFRPLVLGGDHSISGAVFEAMDRVGRLQGLAVLHFDAHTDLLESRFGIEHCFGTWTSHALKKMEKPGAWVQLGIRASGKDKSHWEKVYGLKQYWSKELQKKDAKKFAAELVKHWKDLGCKHLYITNDIDGTDQGEAPSTGTAESHGLKAAWVATVIKEVSTALPLVGADLMEVAPVLGSKADAKKTLSTACKFLMALRWH